MAAGAHQWYHGVGKREVHVLQLFHVAQEGGLRVIAGEERERYSRVCGEEGGGGRRREEGGGGGRRGRGERGGRGREEGGEEGGRE